MKLENDNIIYKQNISFWKNKNRKEEKKELNGINIFSIVGAIVCMIIFIFLLPWLSFWIAYLGGWIAKITIGKQIVAGLSLLKITITQQQIPLLAGTLGWIGGFFKVISTTRNS